MTSTRAAFPIFALLALSLVPPGRAVKPKILVVETMLKNCWFCGEVKLVEVRGAAAADDSRILVEVTDDPGHIARGIAQLGARLELVPTPGGAVSCLAAVQEFLQADRPFLLIADAQRRIVCLGARDAGPGPAGRPAGEPTDEGSGDAVSAAPDLAWVARHYYDFNAAMFRSDDAWVRAECGLLEMWNRDARLSGRLLARSCAGERHALARRALPVLLPSLRELDHDRFLAAVRELRGPDEQASARAHQLLVRASLPWLEELDRMRANTGLERAQQRLDAVRAALDPDRAALRWVAAARARGPDRAAALVLAALPTTTAEAEALVRSHLRVLAGSLDPPLHEVGEDLAALRRRLAADVVVDHPD